MSCCLISHHQVYFFLALKMKGNKAGKKGQLLESFLLFQRISCTPAHRHIHTI